MYAVFHREISAFRSVIAAMSAEKGAKPAEVLGVNLVE
jgi:hypothetical protein